MKSINELNPSQFRGHPYSSKVGKTEAEVIARNIIVIQKRTGDTFRELTWEEYQKERLGDAEHDSNRFVEWAEKPWFERVMPYLTTSEGA